jgi:hypothetical protein
MPEQYSRLVCTVVMSASRTKLLAAFALLAIAISIFGRAAASREFGSLFGGAEGQRSSIAALRTNGPFQTLDEPKSKQRAQFTIYRNAEGEFVCRQATEEEIRERDRIDPNGQGLQRINHYELIGNEAARKSRDRWSSDYYGRGGAMLPARLR